ncbi:hypothetical protein [Paludibacter sp.]|uniref:hypothetical protein n=1 Tax=Paludibacter sp. TaxID=1898105 RepID=UPI0013530274|nr:hypothetical protein [Paludibacter sp.]MTK53844.1 hypothetical protein [Paludibacter sp.]
MTNLKKAILLLIGALFVFGGKDAMAQANKSNTGTSGDQSKQEKATSSKAKAKDKKAAETTTNTNRKAKSTTTVDKAGNKSHTQAWDSKTKIEKDKPEKASSTK